MFSYPSLPAMEVPLSKTPHLYGAEFFLTVLPCIIIPLFSYSCVFLFALCQSLVPYIFPYSFFFFFIPLDFVFSCFCFWSIKAHFVFCLVRLCILQSGPLFAVPPYDILFICELLRGWHIQSGTMSG